MSFYKLFGFVTFFLSSIISLNANSYICGEIPKLEYVEKSKDPCGKYCFNLKVLDSAISKLLPHVSNYPPRFDSEKDKICASKEIQFLTDILTPILDVEKPDPEVLWRAGIITGMGHNLDIVAMKKTTSQIFDKLLELQPQHKLGNFHYGSFLGNIGEFEKSLKYLKTASESGHMQADYGIAMDYVALGDTKNALLHMSKYQENNPKDKSAGKLVEAIKQGKISIKKGQ